MDSAQPNHTITQPATQSPQEELILKVKIISPRQDFFEGEALSVSSKNSVGNFDILPEHANFITMIQNTSIIIRKPNKEELSFNFPLAIIYNSKNIVKIYTDIQIQLTNI